MKDRNQKKKKRNFKEAEKKKRQGAEKKNQKDYEFTKWEQGPIKIREQERALWS